MPREILTKSQCRIIHVPVNSETAQDLSYSSQDVARFWAKVDKTSSACWLWTGYLFGSLGYGGISMSRGKRRGSQGPRYAHRVSWELANGPIPPGQCVLHRCDVPRCVNPDHLFLGTHRQNMEDAARKGRLRVPRRNHQKVNDAVVSQILTLVANGETKTYVAQRYGVSVAFVCLLAKGKRRQYRATTGASVRAAGSSASLNQQGVA